jgi:GNAT superfamily N-acetyltransferase
MNPILKDFSTPSLAGAIRSNLMAWYENLGRSPKAERFDSPEIAWVLTGLSHSFLNAVVRSQLSPIHIDERIGEIIASFQAKNVKMLNWYSEPDAKTADLGEQLLQNGLTYSEGGSGMAVDLLALHEDLVSPAGFGIQAVGDETTLKDWVQTGFTSLGGLETEAEACFELFAGLGFEMPLRNYLGRLDGEPVATSQLFLGAGVAGIYWVATTPKARGQGIGAAMTLAALREARELGYRIGILQSTPMGEGVYRRLGFQEYCRMNHYVFTGVVETHR